MPFQIIPYNAMYHDLVYEICLKTGNSGAGAEHIHNDPMVLGHIYAGPYINLEPESAFLLENELGVCGYIVGALDTLSFFNKVKSDWLPELQKQYSDPTESSKPWNKDEECIHLLFHPEIPQDFPQYPSHLHINLLPRAQGKGLGKKMMDYFMNDLKVRGSKGLHLELGIKNQRAFHFYKKYGMKELKRDRNSIIMGISCE
jgi:ribosomal protein S18 acetylase RimI-like enzyme